MTALLDGKSTATAAAATACFRCCGGCGLARELSGVAGPVQGGNQCCVFDIPIDANPSALQINLDSLDAGDGAQRLSDVSNAGAARHALNLKLGGVHEKPSIDAGQSGEA